MNVWTTGLGTEQGDFTANFRMAARKHMLKTAKPVKADYRPKQDIASATRIWLDLPSWRHCRPAETRGEGCQWTIPFTATMTEVTYYQIPMILGEEEYTTGLDIDGCSCACGLFAGVTLRWSGTVKDLIADVAPDAKPTWRI